jgi:hypothetical protein
MTPDLVKELDDMQRDAERYRAIVRHLKVGRSEPGEWTCWLTNLGRGVDDEDLAIEAKAKADALIQELGK